MRWLTNLWWRLVRFGFRLLYNELAFTYDSVSKVVSLGQWRSWQRTVFTFIRPPDAGPVLELAHGTGDLQIDLKLGGYQTIGYDLSANMGLIASRKMRKRGLQPVLVRGMGQALPFANASFTSVVVTFPTNFIFLPDTLNEIRRVLTVDGVLVVVLSGVFDGSGPLRAVLEWLYRITGQRERGERDTAVVDAVVDKVNAYGFAASIELLQCRRSQAMVMVAQKSESSHPQN